MENTVFISDTHAPYHHRDALAFISAAKEEYGFVQGKHVGDVVDNHFSSYHEIEPGTYAAKEEHYRAKRFVQQLAEIYPNLVVTLGNHDLLTTRKAKTANIMEEHILDYNSRYDVEWDWVERDFFRINKYANCLLTHSISSSTQNNAHKFSHCSVQGHHHHLFGIEFAGDPNVLRWAMSVGCLIDDSSPAMNYNKKVVLKRPILGMGGIYEDFPILIPMQLKKSGRWDGRMRGQVYR